MTPTRLPELRRLLASGLSAMRGKTLIFAVIILVAIAINVVELRAIDRTATNNFDAIRRNPTSDLIDLSYRECAWCRERYGLSLALGTVAPQSRVIIPTPGPFTVNTYTTEWFKVRLYSYGRAATIDLLQVPDAAAILAGLDLTPFIIASGPGGDKGSPWALAVDPARLRADATDPDAFVANVLASGEYRRPDATAGEFVLVRWNTPRADSTVGYQDMLVEISLLPGPVRTELTR